MLEERKTPYPIFVLFCSFDSGFFTANQCISFAPFSFRKSKPSFNSLLFLRLLLWLPSGDALRFGCRTSYGLVLFGAFRLLFPDFCLYRLCKRIFSCFLLRGVHSASLVSLCLKRFSLPQLYLSFTFFDSWKMESSLLRCTYRSSIHRFFVFTDADYVPFLL